jgi:subtilisin family serine protease
MLNQKDDAVQMAKPSSSRKSAPTAPPAESASERTAERTAEDAVTAPPAAAVPAAAGGGLDYRTPVSVVRRKQRYLVGLRSTPGYALTASAQSDAFLDRLPQMDGVEIIRKLHSRRDAHSPAGSLNPTPDLIVVSMEEHRGEALRQHAPPHIIVEVDSPIGHSDLAPSEPAGWQFRARSMPFPKLRRDIQFCVLGEGDRPLANATINLFGPGFPTQGMTDAAGRTAVPVFTPDPADIQAVYARPAAGHWEKYIPSPALDAGGINLVRLTPFSKNTTKTALDRQHGWGQRMMKFDRMAADWSGVGVKVGIIDSGCDTTHPILRHIDRGVDFTREQDQQSWKSDELGHGTHSVGIIAGAATPTAEAVGCAPGAQVWVLKVVPGGYCSDLIDALDVCIEQRLDIVQIGVCCGQFSELVTQKMAAAQLHGIACIMGTGNSAGPVQFPANIPGTLAVAAIGKLGEFPGDTRHAQRALSQWAASAGGIFQTYFSNWGPEVAACAPGVAIISSVPGGGYAAWDGTSMAASHVTGMAALLLSHHPALQRGDYMGRLDRRVAVLRELIRAAAQPLANFEPGRVGAGLPDLERVPSAVQPWTVPGSFPLRFPIAATALRAAGGWG